MMAIISQTVLDDLTVRAKASPRLRMNLDLRNSDADQSQRMLNAIEPGSVLPIHRHRNTSETVVCLRGRLIEEIYDDVSHDLVDTVDLTPNGPTVGVSIPIGQWHRLRSLESGSVVLSCKDGHWEPTSEEDVLKLDID